MSLNYEFDSLKHFILNEFLQTFTIKDKKVRTKRKYRMCLRFKPSKVFLLSPQASNFLFFDHDFFFFFFLLALTSNLPIYSLIGLNLFVQATHRQTLTFSSTSLTKCFQSMSQKNFKIQNNFNKLDILEKITLHFQRNQKPRTTKVQKVP